MIDFTKLWIRGEIAKAIRRNRALSWNIAVNEQTGEVDLKAWAYIGTMKITVKGPELIEIKGSLHQYWNDLHGRGKVNWNRFSHRDLCKAIHSLSERIGLPPEQLPLCTLEYGLNIGNPPFDISRTIDSFCYLYTRRFNEVTSDYGKAADAIQFRLKVYHKGKQAGLSSELMRIELNIQKMQWLQNRGIKIATLADLLRIDYLIALHKELLSRLRVATIHEPNVATKGMNKTQKELWKNANNPNWWKQLSGAELSEANKAHRAIKTAFCTSSTNETIAQLLNDEFALLSGAKTIDSRKSYRVEARAKGKILPTETRQRKKNLTEFDQSPNEKSYPLDERYDFSPPSPHDPSLAGLAVPDHSPRACKHCRNPIVGRRKDALFCGSACKVGWETNFRRSCRRYGRGGLTLFTQTD